MTRSIYIYSAVLLTAALAFSSCEKEPDIRPGDAQTLTICLSPADMELTRAESEYGSDDCKENVINSFKLYFYTSDSETETAVYVYPEDNTLASLTNAGATGYTTNKLTQDPESGKVTLSIALDKKVGDALSQNGKSSNCYVYAVANIPSSVSLPYTAGDASTSRESLKKIPVTASFGPDASVTADPYASRQTDFVMDGSAVLSIDSDKRITVDKTLTGSEYVEMSRAAAKITFYITEIKNVFETSATGDVTGVWIADVDKMRVAYKNTVNYGFIGSETSATDRDGKTASYSTSQGRLLKYIDKAVVKSKHVYISGTELADSTVTFTDCTHPLPFYSYFDEWTSSNDSSAPYLLVQIPWKYTKLDGSGTRYFTCYYAVPFNSVTCRIDRNTWYKVSLSVSILGSGDPENPTDITPSYMVLPWGSTPVETNANLKRYKYLLVDQNTYTMNNVDQLAISFYSSHSLEIESAKLTYTILAPDGTTTVYNEWGRTSSLPIYEPTEDEVSQSSVYNSSDNYDTSKYLYIKKDQKAQNDTLVFNHPLNNEYNDNLDVTEYVLTVKVRHKDDASFNETVVITQRPALYVEAKLNSACDKSYINYGTSGYYRTRSGRYTSPNNNNSGYVRINGGTSGSGWSAVSYITGGNKDPYMYVVSVSSLPSDSNFIIGDPRSETRNNLNYNFSSAQSMYYGSNYSLTYYYPTDATASSNHMIAPSFRIASSYGVVIAITYAEAQYRCASYQEDGYPAGRWRVPTRAEIWYMAYLANKKKIPELLSTESYYWGGDGYAYKPSAEYLNPTRTQDDSFVRCVYDEWYWTDKLSDSQKNTFYWGDKQR